MEAAVFAATLLTILVDGGKGGVGKSLVAAIVCAMLERAGMQYAVIDVDDSNPDVARAHMPPAAIKADEPAPLCVKSSAYAVDGAHAADEWASLLSDVGMMATDHPSGAVVVASGARMLRPFQRWGQHLAAFRPHTLWVVDTSYAALENLDRYLQAMPEAQVAVVLNGGAGGGDVEECDFREWAKSALRTERKLPAFFLPAFPLPDMLRLFSNEGLSLQSILVAPQLTLGQRIMYSAWLSDAVLRIAGALGVSLGKKEVSA